MKVLCFIQGAYFLITGIWPLMHMRSFIAVTGPKHDLWLVRTVAVLVSAIGASLMLFAWADKIAGPIIVLAITSAAGLATIDIVYVNARVIARIYLLDAAAEIVLVATWIILSFSA
jgi:hypothetical protein